MVALLKILDYTRGFKQNISNFVSGSSLLDACGIHVKYSNGVKVQNMFPEILSKSDNWLLRMLISEKNE